MVASKLRRASSRLWLGLLSLEVTHSWSWGIPEPAMAAPTPASLRYI